MPDISLTLTETNPTYTAKGETGIAATLPETNPPYTAKGLSGAEVTLLEANPEHEPDGGMAGLNPALATLLLG